MKKNAWMNNLVSVTYTMAERLHGLFLHFKTERYSYPKYAGKSGYSMVIHQNNTPPKDLLVMSDALNKIGDRNLEKYLILNAIAGNSRPSDLRSHEATMIYDKWINIINSKELFREKCESHILSDHHLGTDLSGSCNWTSAELGDFYSAFVGCASAYNSSSDRLASLSDAFGACYVLHRKPEIEVQLREDVLGEVLLNKILKIKAFTDYWCLT